MFSSTTSILICVAAIWMTQRLLTIQQITQVRKQLVEMGREGRLSVGTAKKIGRRVYVGLAFDAQRTVVAVLVLSGITVFSRGREEPALIGCCAADLASGHTPAGLPPLVAAASRQSAELLIAGPSTSGAPSPSIFSPSVRQDS